MRKVITLNSETKVCGNCFHWHGGRTRLNEKSACLSFEDSRGMCYSPLQAEPKMTTCAIERPDCSSWKCMSELF